MDVPKDVIYWYDGTYEGFLSCVFESYRSHEIPTDIWQLNRPETTFYPQIQVQTNLAWAQRVEASIQRLGPTARRMIMMGFLNDAYGKEIKLLRFLRLCYSKGGQAANMLGNQVVADVVDLEKSVENEACRYREILRFQEREGILGAVIRPTHYVLPLICNHFRDRLQDEDFIIFDNNHCIAMIKKGKKISYTDFMTPVSLATPEDREAEYQAMWKAFFRALTIEERRNEKLQRTHCPKKYWEYMVEMQSGM